jgi:hypothetical protein
VTKNETGKSFEVQGEQRLTRIAIQLLGLYTIVTVALPWGFDLLQWIAESIPWLFSAPYGGVTAAFKMVSAAAAYVMRPPVRAAVDVLGLGLGLVLLMLGVLMHHTSLWLKLAALALAAYTLSTLVGSVAQKLKIPLALRTPELIEFGLVFAAVVLFVLEVISREAATPKASRDYT